MDDVCVRDERTSAIERLYDEMGDRLWWSLFAYTGSRDIASDATAEAFARALAHAGGIDEPARWIWAVGFRLATKELRSARRYVPLSDIGPMVETGDRDEVIELMDALTKLSHRQRAAAVLYYLDGRQANEIASILGIAEATVGVHLHRARSRLRTLLGETDG